MKRRVFLLLAALAGVLAILGGCGGDGGGDAETGTVQLALTDAVDHEFIEVVIAIREIRAVPAGEEEGEEPETEELENEELEKETLESHGKGEGGLPLIVSYDPPLMVNVLELAYQQQLLGQATLPAGTYSQLRLVLAKNQPPPAANYVVLEGDPLVELPVDTPSGQQSGLKVVGEFTVVAGETSAVILDFEPARAIVQAGQSGKWIFKPTGIRVVQTEEVLAAYGTLVGSVMQEEEGPPGVFTEVPVPGARVLALPAGSDEAVAAGTVDPEDGSFRLHLPEGFYHLRVEAGGFEPLMTAPPPFEVVQGADAAAGILLLTPLPGS